MEIEERVAYSPLAGRPPLRLPSGARVAVWIAPNVEYFPPDRGPSLQAGTSKLRPDVLNGAWRQYGARVGFWRLTALLDRLGLRASVVLNADVCDRFPQIVEAGVQRGWEFLGHGLNNGEFLTGLPEAEEREVIAGTRDRIERATGRAPRGWLGPALAESFFTPDLLSELGFLYTGDWCDDDQPHLIQTRSAKPFLSVPYSVETNDYTGILEFHLSGEAFGQLLRDQFDVLYAEGAESARVLCIALHPFLIGQPHRLLHLERALTYMRQLKGVWWTTGGEIADWYLSSRGA